MIVDGYLSAGHRNGLFAAVGLPPELWTPFTWRRGRDSDRLVELAEVGVDGAFDYGPYANGMKAAARPGTVDTEPPKITIDEVTRAGDSVTVSGTATDNMGIRSVLWSAGGKHGAAQMRWSVTGGHYYSRYQWQTNWTATIAEPPSQSITVVAIDIKNNTASADTST